ncbi:MAG: hypothetical protein LBV12_03530 [Puniceicoccales bacterium]|jgi:biopolymer transport protein ExbD|nr:hypothetical protein [Puniceicoccales bacterium]
MRNLIPLACICSAAALLSGCANDIESPFAMSKKDIRESIVIELSADNQVRVNSRSINANKLSEELGALGQQTPGKKVSLVVAEGYEQAAVPAIERMSARAGLGPVTVVTPDAPKVEPTPEKPVAPAVVVEEKPAPAPAASTWETAPVAAPAPVVQSNVVRIDISSSTEFKINNEPVSYEDVPHVLNILGTETPGKKVEIYTEPNFNLRAISYVRDACKKAGLGPIEGK